MLQNTFDQAAIFISILLGLAVRLNPTHVRALPILVLLWCTGGLLCWAGIHVDLAWCGLGFNLTLSSAACGFISFVCTLF